MIDRNLRIIFMGTPAFAVPSLQYLLDAGYPVAGVITAPDTFGGRGMKQRIISPVKQLALTHGLPVLQPANLKAPAFLEEVSALKADLQVVVAFRMLPEVVWNMPPLGTINLHGSLLPAYRGAAPIARAIMAGEKMTGVTTFLLRHEIDTGGILLQQAIPILHDDDAGSLHDRMMYTGAGLVVATADLIASGKGQPRAQDDSRVSHAPKIHHEDGRITWQKPVKEVYDHIRALSPYPGAFTVLDGRELKILRSRPYPGNTPSAPGNVHWNGKQLIIQAGDSGLEIIEVQMSGKKRMTAREFINGYRIQSWIVT